MAVSDLVAKRSKKNADNSTGTPAVVALQQAGIEHRLHPYDTSRTDPHAYGESAAAALGISTDRIFKTLLVDTGESGSHHLAVAVVPVSKSLDLKALATAAGAKRVQLADPAQAERITGYVVGGISPLGQKRALPTVVDSSALELDTLYVSAGRRGLQVELAPSDLIAVTGASTAPITRTS